MSASVIGWRRSKFTRTILGMRVLDATVAGVLAGAALACREQPRARPRPADAGTMVTVYLPSKTADRLAAGSRRSPLSANGLSRSAPTAPPSPTPTSRSWTARDAGGPCAGGVACGAQARQMADVVLP